MLSSTYIFDVSISLLLIVQYFFSTSFTSGNEICFCHTIRKIVMYFTNEYLENVSIIIIFHSGTTDS